MLEGAEDVVEFSEEERSREGREEEVLIVDTAEEGGCEVVEEIDGTPLTVSSELRFSRTLGF